MPCPSSATAPLMEPSALELHHDRDLATGPWVALFATSSLTMSFRSEKASADRTSENGQKGCPRVSPGLGSACDRELQAARI